MAASNTSRRYPLAIILIAIILFIVFLALRLTYTLQILSFNSNANAPTIPANKIVLTSILKKPERFDFITFRNTTQPGAGIWMLRLCGMPGDSIVMNDGELYVNNHAVDSLFSLSHSYVVMTRDTAGLLFDRSTAVPVDSEGILITFPDQLMRKEHIAFRRYTVPEQMVDAYMQKRYGQPWNIDHFGPMKVPPGCYFVLGDNRSNSLDSRYIGFIPEKNFKGTVLKY